jgi:Protein of unknown function (DUF4239)
MTSITTAAISAGCIFLGGLAGIGLKKCLPAHHLDEASKDTIKVGSGILASLSALVLGLLISSAKSSFDATNAGIAQGSAKIILLDRTLADYGPETQDARKELRDAVAFTADRVWSKKNDGPTGSRGFELSNGMEKLQGTLRRLTPDTKPKEESLSEARQLTSDIAQTRWFLIEQQSPLPTTVLVVLVVWLVLLHVSMGLFAPCNGTVLSVLVVSALSVSSALFLVMEMSRPLDGIVKVSDAPVRKALEFLSK